MDTSGQYINAAVYITLGLIGASAHYVKKRYWDNTTKVSFLQYVVGRPRHTISAVCAIAMTELGLSFAQAGDIISLSELVGAVSAGYTFDSGLNQAPDSENAEAVAGAGKV